MEHARLFTNSCWLRSASLAEKLQAISACVPVQVVTSLWETYIIDIPRVFACATSVLAKNHYFLRADVPLYWQFACLSGMQKVGFVALVPLHKPKTAWIALLATQTGVDCPQTRMLTCREFKSPELAQSLHDVGRGLARFGENSHPETFRIIRQLLFHVKDHDGLKEWCHSVAQLPSSIVNATVQNA